jgi:hypothetical protein
MPPAKPVAEPRLSLDMCPRGLWSFRQRKGRRGGSRRRPAGCGPLGDSTLDNRAARRGRRLGRGVHKRREGLR